MVVSEQGAAAGAGRFHRGLHDHAEQLVDVVRRRERLAEAHRHVAEASALVVELADARLQLIGHLVERPAEARELVGPADVDPAIEPAAGEVVRCVHETTQRP